MATEKRLIDANELLRRENKAYLMAKIYPSASAMVTIIHKTLQDLLNGAPTVDAVEVVRCKECRYRHTKASCQGRSLEWYCPNGERMSEENAE